MLKKKVSGEGALMLGIQKDALGAQIKNLRKISSSTPDKSKAPEDESVNQSNSATTVRDKIAHFKNAEKGKFLLNSLVYKGFR